MAFDAEAIDILEGKLGYELWLLSYLIDSQRIIEGGTNLPPTITLTDDPKPAGIAINVGSITGAELAGQVIDSFTPLTFTASYKTLDMIFEWVLEENVRLGQVNRVPRPFLEKIKLLKSTPLEQPPLLTAQSWLQQYSFALYERLLDFRHEIVHRYSFKVTAGGLEVSRKTDSGTDVLALTKPQLSALVKVVVAFSRLLKGDLTLNSEHQAFIEHYLDQLTHAHGLPAFGRTHPPRIVSVVMKLRVTDGRVEVDLRRARMEANRTFSSLGGVLFDLTVHGKQEGQPDIEWHFPIDSVPPKHFISMGLDDYPQWRKYSPLMCEVAAGRQCGAAVGGFSGQGRERESSGGAWGVGAASPRPSGLGRGARERDQTGMSEKRSVVRSWPG